MNKSDRFAQTLKSVTCWLVIVITFPPTQVAAWAPHKVEQNTLSRGQFFNQVSIGFSSGIVLNPRLVCAAPDNQSPALTDLLTQIKKASSQLEGVPGFIEKEQWDSVRAALIEPPLADCWAKTSRPLLSKYAEALGDAGGDELAALEAKEELVSHLRYLDMAVYNNVFNPITVEGKSGATKELVRSYYEDPINEFKASSAALKELVGLATELN